MTEEIQKLRRGLSLQRAGDRNGAERAYRQVLNAYPESIPALNLLGALYVNSGRAEEASKVIAQALEYKPDDAQARVNYALALKELGSVEHAESNLRQSLQLKPDNPVALNCLGSLLLESDRLKEATEHFDRALGLNPDYYECWANLALGLKRRGDTEAALRAVRRALALNPQRPEAHISAAEIFRSKALYDQAIEHYEQALKRHSGNAVALLGLAEAYRESDRAEAALKTLSSLLQLHPDNAKAHSVLGLLQEQLGEPEKAASNFIQAIALNPSMGRGHYQLAQLKWRHSSALEVAAIEQLAVRLAGEKTDDAKYIFFALACVREKQGRYGDAFEAWSEANSISAASVAFDHEQRDRFYREVADSVARAKQKLGSDVGFRDNRPVFLVGMPRSGTTLTGQIIGAHSEVHNLGENSAAFDITISLKNLTGLDYPRGLAAMAPPDLRALGAELMTRFEAREPLANRILDVTPTNFQYLGLLALILPEARFIHCQRDPVDTCFSIFKLPFSRGQDYAHDLVHLGKQYTSYRQMMAQWKKMFVGRILDVSYEQTVANPDSQARRIFEFLGLAFEDAVLEFHQSRELVRTPSASQVRQPIYANAVQVWRRYEQNLAPLLEALGESAED